ncbi:prepilin-type N-terminal cleavage/methylation domain-containing protein [Enterovibrio sp. ZSDZ35]|uniref:Prepilin-type N-terminal cleavage/methylation domain-containing protein n=1 Tax=Enterovibrio qingdaonensis TaxID=2899818 RepID=A0ABT5QVK3_9GAMM|nr:prepilin-type N-terminal cleavage/methylation domain-containing protein [Enterovibrio sp. ZSDZ35]MDD1784321.1 prepilin-type N-terminal cleavage/methylation domain-containing protein [Enterovibrio sp. ZSDZ35]
MTSNIKGFSLVEVLLSMVVIVLSAVSVLKLYSFLEVEKANSVLFMEAKRIAESQVSLMQTINTEGSLCVGKTLADIHECKVSLGADSIFTIAVTTQKTLNHTPSSGVVETYAKVFNVNVSWDDRAGDTQSLLLPVSVSKFTNLYD